jgi:serine/threonine-protein kinase
MLIGDTIGPYRVLAKLGEGGMGQVFRARDTKLNRDVALKVLADSFADDADRLARFTREARTLASLNHPNIAHIHGLEESGDVRALVMELVEGDDLSQRIARGAIPFDEALPIAMQIAEALADAHERGIVHRDLKPANIKVRTDGTVKVLDFGLAKALDPVVASSAEAVSSPTITSSALTMRGVILGTAAYMAPEQAKGKPVDRRADVWAFGAVLYEMLTGQRAFGGEDSTDMIAAVVSKEPDWSALPANTPASIRTLLRRCLEKDRKRRLDSASAVRLELEDARTMPATSEAATSAPRRVAPVALAFVIGAALGVGIASWTLTRPAPSTAAPLVRFTVTPPPAVEMGLSRQATARDFAVAPDGSFLVYRAADRGQLVVHWFDRLEAVPLTGISTAAMPFVSPDSRWIGFVQDDLTLNKVAATGGSAVTLTRLPVWPRGASWVDDDTIIIGTNSPTTGLLRVPAGGGEPTVLTTPDRAQGEQGHVSPSGLPGGRAVLFTIGAAEPENAQIALLDLQTGQRTTLLRGGRDAQYVASGHLVYGAGRAMSAVRFDLARLAVVGDPVRVVDGMAAAPTGTLNVAVTSAGTLVFVPAGAGAAPLRTLALVDRQGRDTPLPAPARPYDSARLSPDGTRIAVSILDQENDIWTWDLARQTLTRVTFDADMDVCPVWTPDSRRVVFASSRTGVYNLYARDVDGAASDLRLTSSANTQVPGSITPDGTRLIGHEVRPQTKSDLVGFALPAGGGAGLAVAEGLVETPFDEWNGEISPDGRFIAYQSEESGQSEVYVRPSEVGATARWQVSSGGGAEPVWTKGGRELIYRGAAQRLAAVAVDPSGPVLRVGRPSILAVTAEPMGEAWRSYDVSSDGQRFLVMKTLAARPQGAAFAGFVVVQNWIEELKRLVPTR